MALTVPQKLLASGISRRAFLQSGTAMAATGLVPRWTFEVDPPASPELFVFRAPDSTNAVIGLSIPPDHAPFGATSARIHVGTKTWSADLRGPARTQFASDNRVRIFAGGGMMGSVSSKRLYWNSMPANLHRQQRFDVWAEISRGEKLRRRIGNPIVAELVRSDQELRQIYRWISPADDRAVLTPVITRIVAARAKRLGIASDPDAYARRLADAILPDVIRFKPASPLGFSDANQNGRHPAERTAEIVHTLLGTSLVSVADDREKMPFDRFPYLISPTQLSYK